MTFDPRVDETGVAYLPIDLNHNGAPTWKTSTEDDVDVAVLTPPSELYSGKYDIKTINYRNFGKTDEIAKLRIGSQIASAGLVPQLAGEKRNYPIFKFGRISSIPNELAPFQCQPNSPPRPLRVWWIEANLVPGNSGSPILFDPLFPPGSDISFGEPRAMIIGLQSLALIGADLAGMTPASYIMDVISRAVPSDADLSLGVPVKK
jgi:hypothetical protein